MPQPHLQRKCVGAERRVHSQRYAFHSNIHAPIPHNALITHNYFSSDEAHHMLHKSKRDSASAHAIVET